MTLFRSKSKQWLTAISVAVALMVALVAFAVPTGLSARADSSSVAEYDFTDAAQLEDFTAVYAATESGGGSVEELSKHWVHNATEGTVTSVRDSSVAAGSPIDSDKRISQLVLSAYEFENFEAEVTTNYAAGSAYGWVGLQFRKSAVTTASRKGGCLAFAQQEGHATLWGDDAFDNTVFEVKNPDADSFKAGVLYTSPSPRDS